MAKTDTRKTLLDKCFKDKHGKVVLAQWPNAPLMLWAVARLLAWPLHGEAEHVVGVVGDLALAVWAVLEVLQGINYFRRGLGAVVLAFLIASLIR